MCFQTAYKLVLCLMRRLGHYSSDKLNASVAGFLSALTLGLDTEPDMGPASVLPVLLAVHAPVSARPLASTQERDSRATPGAAKKTQNAWTSSQT